MVPRCQCLQLTPSLARRRETGIFFAVWAAIFTTLLRASAAAKLQDGHRSLKGDTPRIQEHPGSLSRQYIEMLRFLKIVTTETGDDVEVCRYDPHQGEAKMQGLRSDNQSTGTPHVERMGVSAVGLRYHPSDKTPPRFSSYD